MLDDAPFACDDADAPADGRVQCPNCCRLAFVVRRRMGLVFYKCELCGTVGATPDTGSGRHENDDR